MSTVPILPESGFADLLRVGVSAVNVGFSQHLPVIISVIGRPELMDAGDSDDFPSTPSPPVSNRIELLQSAWELKQ
jgi:hypothetical protein